MIATPKRINLRGKATSGCKLCVPGYSLTWTSVWLGVSSGNLVSGRAYVCPPRGYIEMDGYGRRVMLTDGGEVTYARDSFLFA